MRRMRTVPKAMEELRAKDPDTCVSVYMLRHWVKIGKIKSVKAGKNFLIDMDELEAFLSNS